MPATVKRKWKEHTDRLLAKYADHTFKIKASMLEVNDLENEISFVPKSDYQRTDDATEVSVIKKTRARLEQLERSTSGTSASAGVEQTIELSQSQYVAKVKEMEKGLVANWEQNHKVEALRIAIKCIKLLAETNTAPQLYPCVFVLVSEVLDSFGQLVFKRIHARASEDESGQPLPEPLGDHFMSSDINIQASETCRNWFYKTACIRELLPRIYIEIALLGCYRFLCDGEYPQIVARLSNMIKGVGEPMVALYARLYLALTSSELLGTTSPTEQTIVVSSSLFDYFYAFNWFRQNKLEHWLITHKMDHGDYLALHSPAVEWIIKCTAPGATQDTFDTLLAHYHEYFDNSMVLKHLCECFGAQFYASAPTEMLDLIRTASPSRFSACHLYSLLAVQLSNVPTVADDEPGGKLQFLNVSWSSITSQEDIAQYMECAAAYMKLIVAHFSHREALILLKDVVRHLNAATPEQLTAKTRDISAFITRLGYVSETNKTSDRAQDEEQEALLMLYTDCRRAFYKLEPIKVLLSTMILRLAMQVHKRIGDVAASVIEGTKRVQARRSFIQSCLAFAHVTIPSIEAPLTKLQLMVSAANVALVTNCIPQMDALVKAAIVLLAELEPATIESATCTDEDTSKIGYHDSSRVAPVELFGDVSINCSSNAVDRVVQAISQLMSVLVYAPSLNDEDAFYFVTALRRAALERMVWVVPGTSSVLQRRKAAVARVRVLLLFVQIYALWGQKGLPDKLSGVDSNDVLYGGDDAFYNEAHACFSSTIDEVAREIEALGELGETSDTAGNAASGANATPPKQVLAAQSELMLDLVNVVAPMLEYDESRLIEPTIASGSIGLEEISLDTVGHTSSETSSSAPSHSVMGKGKGKGKEDKKDDKTASKEAQDDKKGANKGGKKGGKK
ncbi:hypothetical protein BBO99_00006514 [Phytophthora kernoviae]|uniref:Uncharacterized protein n=2 Tax=Phytophthora kernoviae TaxID=325452 RepID=A0A421FD89_9STRA|nr:hypothetical protein G195_007383 [Phytophthora kernoviae 00238/432]KAG2522801.1 hypothetical protein JM18_005949 [Phytophthora kernoviae]RLN37936.1 hypothetical protein BBI17_002951 [Phytophthora kernoviae]RLN77744.1 hypothetical protein BBO99_00006514 [Phytophthora kernoviae]